MKILDRDVSSENSKFFDNEDVSDQLFSSQSQMYSTRSSLIGNTTEDFRKHAVKRKPFRELNYDQKRRTDRQTIWRPWWGACVLSDTRSEMIPSHSPKTLIKFILIFLLLYETNKGRIGIVVELLKERQ